VGGVNQGFLGNPQALSVYSWSRNAQFAFVLVAMPVLVVLLIVGPYLLSHYVVNPHSRFNYIPPPLGGERALEGHWTGAPVVATKRVQFAKPWRVFGWVAAEDDHVAKVFPAGSGTVSKIYVKAGQAVSKDAPLFAIRSEVADSQSRDVQAAPPQETTISAPAAGVVTELAVEVGQEVAVVKGRPPSPAATITDLSTVSVDVKADEGVARSLSPEEAVKVEAPALAERIFTGHVSAVSQIDSKDADATVRTVIDNADGDLKLNMLAAVSAPKLNDETLVVPESAVLFENGSGRVFVMSPGNKTDDTSPRLTPRAVQIGRIQDGLVEVLNGLQSGENVEASDAVFIDRAAKGY
jgi:multidrug efflux pump subunit AcrA (membrane-fusion protein)